MADDERGIAAGLVPGMVQELIAQLRAASVRLEGLAGFDGRRMPSDRAGCRYPVRCRRRRWPRSPTASAAQRRSIEALGAPGCWLFEEQLAVMEQLLGPLAEWSRTWADLEGRLMNMGRKPQAAG